MSWLQAVLVVNIVLQLGLFIIAVRKLRGGYLLKTHPYLFIFGSFVWEDSLVLSLFWLISSFLLLYLDSLKALIVLILIFLVVRSIGELLYSLFQQFKTDGHRPYDYGFKKIDRKNIFIIYQVLALSVITLSLFLLYLISDSAF